MKALSRGFTDDWRITYLSIIILVVVTLTGGLMVYLIMQRQSESILDKELEASVHDHASELTTLINNHIGYARAMAARPLLSTPRPTRACPALR